MDNNAKALSGLSYLSIFFFPFLLPIIVYFASKDVETRRHAKRALISHTLTILLSVILVVSIFYTFVRMPIITLSLPSFILLFIVFIFIVTTYAAIFIWNIVQAVKIVR